MKGPPRKCWAVEPGGLKHILKSFRVGEADQEFVLKTIFLKGVLEFLEEVFALLAYAVTRHAGSNLRNNVIEIGALKPESDVYCLAVKGVRQTRAQGGCCTASAGTEAMAPIIEGTSSVHTRVAENVHDMLHHCARFLNQRRDCLHFAPDSMSSDYVDDGQISPRPGRVVLSVQEHVTVMAQACELKQTRDHVSCQHRLPALEVRTNLVPTDMRI